MNEDIKTSYLTVMLTGDNKCTASAVGKQLGIDVQAELLPEDKQRIVGKLQSQGFKVAKIGDGAVLSYHLTHGLNSPNPTSSLGITPRWKNPVVPNCGPG